MLESIEDEGSFSDPEEKTLSELFTMAPNVVSTGKLKVTSVGRWTDSPGVLIFTLMKCIIIGQKKCKATWRYSRDG